MPERVYTKSKPAPAPPSLGVPAVGDRFATRRRFRIVFGRIIRELKDKDDHVTVVFEGSGAVNVLRREKLWKVKDAT